LKQWRIKSECVRVENGDEEEGLKKWD